MTQYQPETNQFKSYDKSDGLPLNDFNANSALKSRSEALYFGSSEGLIYFDPTAITTNPNPPEVYITNLKLFNKTIDPGAENSPLQTNILLTESIVLSPEQSVFSLEFVALNYTHTEKNQYAYRLKGLENDWNYVGSQRYASYSNLDAGHYTFEVKASNNDKVWTQSPHTLEIEVLPFWYERWYVKAFIVTALFCLAAAIYLVRVSILKRQQNVLAQQVEDRTREVTQKKEEIELQAEVLRNINLSLEQKVTERTIALEEALAELNSFTYRSAHDLRGPLARLLGLCNLGMIEVGDEKALEYFSLLEHTASNMNELLTKLMRVQEMKVKDIAWEEVQIAPLIHEIIAKVVPEEIKDDVILELDVDQARSLITDRVFIGTLLENLIGNAIAYRQNYIKPKVSVSSRQDAETITLTIRNNGAGIGKEIADQAFDMFVKGNEKSSGMGLGLYEAKVITKKLGGSIDLIDPAAGHTVISVRLPIRDAS